ncbi:hypothetical protein T492DRAFT_546276 [Pavlovales sp. CCMP2436]|nr:hypothetical protein T492DRAFT_546276 [Pavlovales sp. CCMP2436]
MLSLSASLLLLFSSVQATGDFACEESPTERADAGPPGVCTDGPSVLSVAFGSCHHQGQPSPTLLAAAASEPDVFVWMGDNLYNDLDPWGVPCEPIDCGRRSRALTSPILIGLFGLLPVWLKRAVFQHAIASRDDEAAPSVSDDTAGLPANYAALAAKPEFQYLRERVPLMFATWDECAPCPYAPDQGLHVGRR